MIANLIPDNSLSKLQTRIQHCVKCNLCESNINKFDLDKGYGKLPLKFGKFRVLLVGINPSINRYKDSMTVGAFTGRTSGDLLTNLLDDCDINVEDLYITNLVRCSTPNNRQLTQSEINSCKEFLFTEIFILKPKLIVSLGKVVTEFLKDNKDKIRSFCDCDFLFLPHPNYLRYNPEKTNEYLEQLSKIKKYIEI